MGLFDRAANLFGPIGPDQKKRILRYLEKPTEKGWDNIQCIVISEQAGFTRPRTVWQAVIAVDPTFPRSKEGKTWERIPDPFTVARAIREATK
jgi:hypothetical protein